jgi:hypothetical protein
VGKSSLLIALCITLLWVRVGYSQSDQGAANAFSQPAAGCPFFFQPQKFPATGQTTSYVNGDDGAIRAGAPLKYSDNGDGTVTDRNTLLMWEKKDQAEGGIHNWDNTYPWQGNCSNSASTVCGTDADCPGAGTCSVKGGGMTIFQWVAALNTPPCFARHCDWRIPNVRELQSIVDYQVYLPPVAAAFNNNCMPGCTVDGAGKTVECSCTQSAGTSQAYYWSSTTYAPSPIVKPPGSMLAWGVLFGDGDELSAGKTDHDYVRAVRCGL